MILAPAHQKDTGGEGKIGLISNVGTPVGCFLYIHTINRLSSFPGGLFISHLFCGGGGRGRAIYFSKMQ